MQRVLAQLPSNTALLEPTKRHIRMQLVHAVNPRRTRLESVGRLDCPIQVLREHGCSKTVHRVVGQSDHVFLVFEFNDHTNGTENFFLDDLHVRGSVGENGRLDEVAFGPFTFTADLDLGTGVLARLDVAHDALRNSSVSDTEITMRKLRQDH